MERIHRNIFHSCVSAAMNGTDLVIGSRMAGEDSQMPLTRRVGKLLLRDTAKHLRTAKGHG